MMREDVKHLCFRCFPLDIVETMMRHPQRQRSLERSHRHSFKSFHLHRKVFLQISHESPQP